MATITKALSQVISGFLCLLITIYQRVISPFLGPRCRFYPSCSCYAQQALTMHGVIKGSYLAIKRIARCHPLCEGGVDPVPTIKGKHHG